VLVVGEDALARSGLAALLANEAGIQVAGQAAPGDDWIEAASIHRPHVGAWDLGPDPSAGGDTLRDLERAGFPVLVLLAGEGLAAEAFAAGARGLLFRDSDPARIAAALRAVALGVIVLDELAAASMLPPAAVAVPLSPADALTPREQEVLELLSQGLANKTIADRLGISEHTAKFHVNAILGKLGVQSRTEAVVRAARLGLVIL
jgi:DNA-binding NarL/FixJ family response regulator